jgi:hypothetical protein
LAWTYSDWITQTTDSTRLTRLRLHIQEVSDKITQEVSSGGNSRSSSALQAYLADIRKEEKSLAAAVSGASGGVSRARFVRARGGGDTDDC